MQADRIVETREAMQALGRRLAALLRAGDLVVLTGDLGSGKTTLAQGLGEGLRVRGPVTSPTFVIARVHPSEVSGPPLVHVDAYRLASIAEVDDLDLDAGLDESVTVVEWGEGLVDDLTDDRLHVAIHRSRGGEPDDDATDVGDPDVGDLDEPRSVRIEGIGARWADVELRD